ncbi:hypothetical protein [Flavobacterium sp. NKUCC04_CG]|uniref:hypothetical protein n=1 Tax=Flavobacterium sp. NKUCC04_CG TaxID=2842121 RepID=UPI001C5BDDAB|nr:hypothetical protein [Flavobacterium sp. NKUCC04_CG]MBW3520443.1 hypothetical protein [Flavobacterium sp. NKUCC04_CG]
MKTKDFYAVLIPLINSILTGKQSIDYSRPDIPVSPDFIASRRFRLPDSFNKYVLQCIDAYLSTLNKNQLENLTKLFLENRRLLSIAVLIRDGNCCVQQSYAFYNDELTLILLDFLDQKNIDHTLHLTLYLYLENLLYVDVIKDFISFESYQRILLFNSRVRTKEEVFF